MTTEKNAHEGWWETEESEEQYVLMNILDLVDMESTKWVWNFEYNIENCSENHTVTVSRKKIINREDNSKRS